MFSKEGPHAWQTKKGSDHIHRDMEHVAAAQAKEDARASIERIARKEKGGTEQTETV